MCFCLGRVYSGGSIAWILHFGFNHDVVLVSSGFLYRFLPIILLWF